MAADLVEQVLAGTRLVGGLIAESLATVDLPLTMPQWRVLVLAGQGGCNVSAVADDLGIPPAAHGDLTAWTGQGVLLLNRVLTVRAGASGSHRGIGWEEVTEAAVRALVSRGTPLVGLLWGSDARRMAPLLREGGAGVVESPHPSPLSASRGFFGSRPFSRVNALLEAAGAEPVDWRIPD